MAKNVSIVVSPRERFTSITDSLNSLFATIPSDVAVIVVEGCTPESIREEIKEIQNKRPFEWIALDYFVTPQEARNKGFENVDTEYVVFTDNDIHYEDHWLECLLENAEEHGSELVAPLICIGPPNASKIHHAGGRLVIRIDENDLPHVTEQHQLMNRPIAEISGAGLPVYNEIVEFHCFLGRTDYIRRIGPLDERLITREQIDFGLRSKFHNAKVSFEEKSVVTYMATTDYLEIDLPYMVFRWSDELAFRSLDVFTETWGIETNRHNTINNWIRAHRARAFATCYPEKVAQLGEKEFIEGFVRPREKELNKIAFATRADKSGEKYPTHPTGAVSEKFMDKYRQDPEMNFAYKPPFLKRSKELVVAGMATMPSRRKTLWTALESILPQVDRLYLFLDRFPQGFSIQHEKIVPIYSQQFGDRRANGKLMGMLMCGVGPYYLSVDDDIEYPSDYAERMVDFLRERDDQVAVGVHASKLKRQQFGRYLTDRSVLHRSAPISSPSEVDVLGTCTTAFSTRKVNFDVRRWKMTNMVDLMFAMECHKLQAKLVSIPREENWIKCIEEVQADSIYARLRQDDSVQTKIAKQLISVTSGANRHQEALQS